MFAQKFDEETTKDFQDLQVHLKDVKEHDNAITFICTNERDGRDLRLYVKEPDMNNREFDFSESFITDALVRNVSNVWSYMTFICSEIHFVNNDSSNVVFSKG